MSKKRRHRHHGSSVDDFLREEGVLEEMQAVAIKEVIAWQLQKAMKEKKLSFESFLPIPIGTYVNF